MRSVTKIRDTERGTRSPVLGQPKPHLVPTANLSIWCCRFSALANLAVKFAGRARTSRPRPPGRARARPLAVIETLGAVAAPCLPTYITGKLQFARRVP